MHFHSRMCIWRARLQMWPPSCLGLNVLIPEPQASTDHWWWGMLHYNDITMGAMASQSTSHTIVYSTVYSGTDQRKHQCSTSLAFGRGIHRWPVISPHKWPVTRKMFPFDDGIMRHHTRYEYSCLIYGWIPANMSYKSSWMMYNTNDMFFSKTSKKYKGHQQTSK